MYVRTLRRCTLRHNVKRGELRGELRESHSAFHSATYSWVEALRSGRGVGIERNLVHLVEKSVEIKLKSWEIKADFFEIKFGNQPNPPAPPTFTTYDVIFEGNHGKSKQKSGNLVRQNCSLPTPRQWSRKPESRRGARETTCKPQQWSERETDNPVTVATERPKDDLEICNVSCEHFYVQCCCSYTVGDE